MPRWWSWFQVPQRTDSLSTSSSSKMCTIIGSKFAPFYSGFVNFLSRKCVNSAALFVALPGARFPSSPCDFNMPISNILSKNLHAWVPWYVCLWNSTLPCLFLVPSVPFPRGSSTSRTSSFPLLVIALLPFDFEAWHWAAKQTSPKITAQLLLRCMPGHVAF